MSGFPHNPSPSPKDPLTPHGSSGSVPGMPTPWPTAGQPPHRPTDNPANHSPSQPTTPPTAGMGMPAPGAQSQAPNGVRIGDHERTEAIDALGSHFAAGRLTLDEFEERSTIAASSKVRSDLDRLFFDLPPLTPQEHQASAAATPLTVGAKLAHGESYYDLSRRAREGQRHRAGFVALTAIIATICTIALVSAGHDVLAAISCLIVPLVAILVYPMRVGPASWYLSSELKEIRRQQQAIEREQARQQALAIEAQRRQQSTSVRGLASKALYTADTALDIVNGQLEKRSRKQRLRDERNARRSQGNAWQNPFN